MLALKSCVFNLSIFEAENMTVAKWGSLGGGDNCFRHSAESKRQDASAPGFSLNLHSQGQSD